MKILKVDKDKLGITTDEAVKRIAQFIRSAGFSVAELEDGCRKVSVALGEIGSIREKPIARGYIAKSLRFIDRLFYSIDFLGCLQYIFLFIALYGLWVFLAVLFRGLQ